MALPPAEALVLLDPDGDNAIQAVKVTFLGLLAGGTLKLEELKNRLLGNVTVLRLGISQPKPRRMSVPCFRR